MSSFSSQVRTHTLACKQWAQGESLALTLIFLSMKNITVSHQK